ncbi:ankyrin repeat-containing domain protein [Ilyonectria destructans]|nr:ankyrin repeat-containing domain protein [Ilyonectria destructans]
MPINWSLYEQDAVKKYMDDRMSAKDACKWINDKYGTSISLRQFKSKFMGLKNLTSLEWKAVYNEIEIHKQSQDQVFDVYISGRRQDPERVKRAIQRCDKHVQVALDPDIDVGFETVGEHRIEIRTSISQGVVTDPVLENPGTILAAEESIELLANLDVEPLILTPNAEDMADLAIGIRDTSAHDLSTLQQGDHSSPGFSAFLSSFLSSPLNHSNIALVSPSPVDAPITSEMIHESASHAQQVILSPRQQLFPDATFTSPATFASILSDSMQVLMEGSQASWNQSEVTLLFPDICQNSTFNPKNGFCAAEWDQVSTRVPRGEPGWIASQLKHMDPKVRFPHHVASLAEFVFNNYGRKWGIPFKSTGRKSRDQLFSVVGYLISNEFLDTPQFANFIKWIFDNDQFSALTEFLLINSTNMSTFITELLHMFANSRDRLLFHRSSMMSEFDTVSFHNFCDHIFRRYPTETFNLIQAAEKRAIEGSLGRDLITHFARNDDLEAAAKLLHSRNVNVNFVASDIFGSGSTPLKAAVLEESVEMATFLIDDARADVNQRFGHNEKNTALCTATKGSYVKMVEVLLEKGATVYQDLMIGDKNLLTYARKHSAPIFKLLTGPSRNNTPDIFDLVEAAKNGNRTLCQFIEDHQIVRDEILERGLYYAIETANVRAMRCFLHRKVDPDTPNYRRARNAGEFDENPDSRPPILLVAENFNEAADLVHLLMQAGSKPTHDDLTQLCHDLVSDLADNNLGQRDVRNIFLAMIQAGCNVAAIGPSALEISAGHGRLLECALLIDAGIINIDEYGVGGRSGLQAAALEGETAAVEYLIDRGADINLPASPVDRWPDQEYHRAIWKDTIIETDYAEMADGLRAARFRERRLTALQAAALRGHTEVVDSLIEAGANSQAPANTSGLITLLEAAAGPGAWTEKYVRSGQQDRRMSIFNKLLARSGSGAINRTDGTDSTVLHRLIRTAPIQCLDLALRAGARTEDRNPVDKMTPLQYAAMHGKFDAMELLIKYNANINAPAADDSKHGRTALQAALEDPFQFKNLLPFKRDKLRSADEIESMAALLLQHHARINDPAGKYHGRTALQQATSWKEPSAKIIAFLLIHGAEVNAQPAEVGGITALQGAAIRGDVQVARMLIARGADINAPPALRDGRTALEGAAEHGRLGMVQFLLKNGAVPDLSKGFGTAIKLAEKNERFDIADLLRREQEQAYTNLFNTLSDQLAWNPEPQMPELGTVMDNDDQDEMVI